MNLRVLFAQNVPRTGGRIGSFGTWRMSDCGALPTRRSSEWAQADSSIIIAFDEDFADARMFPIGSHCGVVRLRVWPAAIEMTERAIERLPTDVHDEDLSRSLVIVDGNRIRVRRAIRHG